MAELSNVAAWTGVAGAAVGGGFAYLGARVQAKTTRSEGAADRNHKVALVAESRRHDSYAELARAVQVVLDRRSWMMRGQNYIEPPSPAGPEGLSSAGTLVEIYGSRSIRTLTSRLIDEWNEFSHEMDKPDRDEAACTNGSNALAVTEEEILRTIREEVRQS